MNFGKQFLVALIVGLVFGSVVPAQVRVVKSAREKINLDISGIKGGQSAPAEKFLKTLRSDLRLAGWFRLTQSEREYRASGFGRSAEGNLDVEIRVRRLSDSKQVFGKSYRTDSRSARHLAHRVADDLVLKLAGRRGIAATKIALVGQRNGNKELYLCDSDGGNLRRLTHDNSISLGPNWGPKGESLVYTTYRDGFPDVYELEFDSGRHKKLAGYGGLNSDPDLSPNGRYLALILSKSGNPDLYVKDLANGRIFRLTRTRTGVEASPSWSPDGRKIAYVSDQSGRPQIYTILAKGGRPTRLTSRGSQNVAPDWGENGWIAYSSLRNGSYRIALLNPSTGRRSEIEIDGTDYEDPSWAPDGRHIVCGRTENYRSSICQLDTWSDGFVTLLEGSGSWYSPVWSPLK